MKQLTEKEAIKLTKKLWRRLARTGEMKEDVDFRRSFGLKVMGNTFSPAYQCFLCAYVLQELIRRGCHACPYYQRWGRFCTETGTVFNSWDRSRYRKQRRKYAKELLKELEELQ